MFFLSGQSESPLGSKRPNEDRWDFKISPQNIILAMGDGVTQMTDSQGVYPEKISWEAAQIATASIVHDLRQQSPGPHDAHSLRFAVHRANCQIRELNTQLRRCHTDTTESIGTSIVVVWLHAQPNGSADGFIASLGDSVSLLVPSKGKPSLLTADQLHACHTYSYEHFHHRMGESVDEARKRRYKWEREFAQNNPDAVAPDNPNEHIGYGALNGDPRALRFLDIRPVHMECGDRLVITTSALRVCRNELVDARETTTDYSRVVRCVQECPTIRIPRTLIEFIRDCEVASDTPAEDATVAVIETAA